MGAFSSKCPKKEGKNLQRMTLKRSKSKQQRSRSKMTVTKSNEEFYSPSSSLTSRESAVQLEIKSNSKLFYFVNSDKNNLQPDSSELLRSLLALKSICECRHAYRSQSRLFPHARLFRDQSLSKTRTNKPVVPRESGKKAKMFNRKDLEKMRHSADFPADVSLIMKPPFSNLDMIVPGIYQTAISGIVLEDLVEARIKVIINATYEMPLVTHSGFVSFRVPVEDDGSEPIHEYFDDVADLMEAARLHGNGSVVHCMAGVSRSATLVLAYMIKYTTITLMEAFVYVRSIRAPSRPNMGFLKQLMQYETRIKGRCSVELEEILVKPSSDGEYQIISNKSAAGKEPKESFVRVTLPKFYRHNFPDLYKMEIKRQMEHGKPIEQQDQMQPVRSDNKSASPVRNKSNTNNDNIGKKNAIQRRSSRDHQNE